MRWADSMALQLYSRTPSSSSTSSISRKEALLSSQIEGTQSSLSDLLLFESREPGVPIDDVEEVSNYVLAMQHSVRRIAGGFPLSLRLIREIQGILLRGGRGANRRPGEIRHSQNCVGGTRPGNAAFVPPAPEELMACLTASSIFSKTRKISCPFRRSRIDPRAICDDSPIP